MTNAFSIPILSDIFSNMKIATSDKAFNTASYTSNLSKNYSTSTQTTQNYAPTITRQIDIIINSPESSIISKKDASATSSVEPSTEQTLPTYQSGSSIPASGDASLNLDFSSIILLAGAGIGGFFIYKGLKKGAKK